MKVLKIDDDLHEKLKNFLKDSNIFMQSFVEYHINQAIEKRILYSMEDKIENFRPFIYPLKNRFNKR